MSIYVWSICPARLAEKMQAICVVPKRATTIGGSLYRYSYPGIRNACIESALIIQYRLVEIIYRCYTDGTEFK